MKKNKIVTKHNSSCVPFTALTGNAEVIILWQSSDIFAVLRNCQQRFLLEVSQSFNTRSHFELKPVRLQIQSEFELYKTAQLVRHNPHSYVISVSRTELKLLLNVSGWIAACQYTPKMTARKQILPSFASIISILSTVFYCVGFFRVELQLNEQKDRITSLESIAEVKSPTNNPDVKIIKNIPGKSDIGSIVTCRK